MDAFLNFNLETIYSKAVECFENESVMKKKSAVVILIALVINMICLVSCETESNKKELGEGPMTCYVEGELLTDKYGDKIVFFDDVTCKQQYLEDPSYRVKAIDGKFYMTIHSEHISPYTFVLYEPLIKTATSPHGQFFAENNAHIKIQIFAILAFCLTQWN